MIYLSIFIRPTKRQFKCNWTCSRTGQWDWKYWTLP